MPLAYRGKGRHNGWLPAARCRRYASTTPEPSSARVRIACVRPPLRGRAPLAPTASPSRPQKSLCSRCEGRLVLRRHVSARTAVGRQTVVRDQLASSPSISTSTRAGHPASPSPSCGCGKCRPAPPAGSTASSGSTACTSRRYRPPAGCRRRPRARRWGGSRGCRRRGSPRRGRRRWPPGASGRAATPSGG